MMPATRMESCMIPSRSVAAALLLFTLLTAACTKNEPATPGDASSSRAAAASEGAPRIVTSADGVHIQYRVYGSGDPAVVLVHCWSCDSNYWSAQVEALKPLYTV